MGVVEALEGACSPLEVCEVLESLDAEEALVEDIVPPMHFEASVGCRLADL
jgi:hypothetical protein